MGQIQGQVHERDPSKERLESQTTRRGKKYRGCCGKVHGGEKKGGVTHGGARPYCTEEKQKLASDPSRKKKVPSAKENRGGVAEKTMGKSQRWKGHSRKRFGSNRHGVGKTRAKKLKVIEGGGCTR